MEIRAGYRAVALPVSPPVMRQRQIHVLVPAIRAYAIHNPFFFFFKYMFSYSTFFSFHVPLKNQNTVKQNPTNKANP